MPGFERTQSGLNGAVASVGGARRVAARTFVAMGPAPRAAVVDVVTRAESDRDASDVLAGARTGSSVTVAAPAGAEVSGGTVLTFRRGLWVATLSVGSPRDGHLLVPVALAQAALLPAPAAGDLGPATRSTAGTNDAAMAAVVGGGALAAATVFLGGLLVLRRRGRVVIPEALPPARR